MDRRRYDEEADRLIGSRVAELRELTFDGASALPEAVDGAVLVGGRKCVLTTFRQGLRPEEVLITVQVTRRTWLGLGSIHREKAIVFHRDGSVRDASPRELLVSGG